MIKNLKISQDNDQIKMASNMMGSMDNESIRNMMKTTGMGMDMSDSQIEMMKGMFKNEEMVKNCMETMSKNNSNTSNQPQETRQEQTITSNTQVNNTMPNVNPGGMDFSKMSEMMAKNPDLMKSAMSMMSGNKGEGGMPNPANMDFSQMSDMLSKNPELMKMAMSGLTGGNGAGVDPNMMMSSMQTILWILSIPQKIKEFFKSTRGILFTLIFVILIVSYYYG